MSHDNLLLFKDIKSTVPSADAPCGNREMFASAAGQLLATADMPRLIKVSADSRHCLMLNESISNHSGRNNKPKSDCLTRAAVSYGLPVAKTHLRRSAMMRLRREKSEVWPSLQIHAVGSLLSSWAQGRSSSILTPCTAPALASWSGFCIVGLQLL
jgi:hypothetical protein